MEHRYQARHINNVYFHLSVKCVWGAQLEDQPPIHMSGDRSPVSCLCCPPTSVSLYFCFGQITSRAQLVYRNLNVIESKMQHTVGKRPVINFIPSPPYSPSNFRRKVYLKNIERCIAFEANCELFPSALKSF